MGVGKDGRLKTEDRRPETGDCASASSADGRLKTELRSRKKGKTKKKPEIKKK